MKKSTLFISAAVILLAAFVAGMLIFKSKQGEEAQQAATESRSALVRMHSPMHGPADAKVEIVEFLDPACGTCRDFYPRVKQMAEDHPGQVRVALRYAPFHANSDQVVAMLYAAGKQGKHVEALEALLAAQNDWVANHVANPERAWTHLEGLGLDMEQLRSDMNSPAVVALVRQDLDDATTMKVTATPEYFVNGKPLPTWGWEQLVTLVNEELAGAYH
ncbi:MAG: thioredoxin domain-containing protein [Thiobacillus sp.]|nr:thioredoxin domain-containing protein [Thiobacillus sp.]